MFSQNEKEWILEAINHLKRRKARPDFSRISLRMKRKHQLTIAQTRQILDSLVESGIVVKAVYKNNTSYRDVSKWKKGKLGGQILNSKRMLKRFVKAIKSKLSTVDDRKGTGVSATEIEEWLSHNNEDKCFLSGAALRDAIENEVRNGYLKKVEINNAVFYSVNSKTIPSNLDDLRSKKGNSSGSNDYDNPQLFQLDYNLYSTEDDFNFIRSAIYETEQKEGSGSKLEDIQNWMKDNISSNSSALCTSIRNDDNSLLLTFLENLVKSGFILEKRNEKGILFSVAGETNDFKISKSKAPISNSNHTVKAKLKNEGETCDNQVEIKHNMPPLLKMPSKQNNKTTVVSLRPPSKRKRILKNHGPDFEMELPTKSKSRFTSASVGTSKEYSFPTPLDSPVSEKSETNLEQSFKFDLKKKRGRPKKLLSQGNEHCAQDDDDDDKNNNDDDDDNESNIVEEKQNGLLSEQSSVYQDDNDNEDVISEPPLLPDVSMWTSQQVANHFFDQGYEEESKQMIENDLDGIALGLLRRSDIIGPPAGGMLKIKKLGVALKLFRDIRNLLCQGHVDNYTDPYDERAFYRS